MSEIHLLHTPGVDQLILARFLTARGHLVRDHTAVPQLRESVGGVRSPSTPDRVVVIQEASVNSDSDFTFLEGSPSLVLGTRHLAPPGAPRELISDPCFLDDLDRAVRRLAEGQDPPDTTRLDPSDRPPESRARSLLLRGVAHALNNPLSAALGWLQLLSSSEDPRYLERVTKELGRIEQITHALSLLGRGSSGLASPFDLRHVVAQHAQRLGDGGLDINLSLSDATTLMLAADQSEWELMLDLLLGSFHEDRGRLDELALSLAQEDRRLIFEMQALGITAPEGMDPRQLEDLLEKKIRHSRALGLALAHLLMVEARGLMEILPLDQPGIRIRLSMPMAEPGAMTT